MGEIFTILIIIIGGFSAIRILFGLFLANVNEIGYIFRKESNEYNPLISIIVPAFNEEKTIYDCVQSIIKQSYQNKQIIIVNDGSTDLTLSILKKLAKEVTTSNILQTSFSPLLPKSNRFIIVNQENGGKSTALNNGIKNYAKGELVTVLDADSELESEFLSKIKNHFNNPAVIAMASNIQIKSTKNFIDLVQCVEYLLGYRLKGSESLLNLEYIIGGIGSTFRKDALKLINYYSTNTITEDIDLTMKLIKHFGNKNIIFGYAAECHVKTPAVHNLQQLIRQRYRWKFGRFNALIKYRKLIFNPDLTKYSVTLSWWKLPKVFVEETFLLLEPFFLFWFIWVIWFYNDLFAIFSILLIYLIYSITSILLEDVGKMEQYQLLALSPLTYIFLYIINIVDFICLLKCITNWRQLIASNGESKWVHVDR